MLVSRFTKHESRTIMATRFSARVFLQVFHVLDCVEIRSGLWTRPFFRTVTLGNRDAEDGSLFLGPGLEVLRFGGAWDKLRNIGSSGNQLFGEDFMAGEGGEIASGRTHDEVAGEAVFQTAGRNRKKLRRQYGPSSDNLLRVRGGVRGARLAAGSRMTGGVLINFLIADNTGGPFGRLGALQSADEAISDLGQDLVGEMGTVHAGITESGHTLEGDRH